MIALVAYQVSVMKTTVIAVREGMSVCNSFIEDVCVR